MICDMFDTQLNFAKDITVEIYLKYIMNLFELSDKKKKKSSQCTAVSDTSSSSVSSDSVVMSDNSSDADSN